VLATAVLVAVLKPGVIPDAAQAASLRPHAVLIATVLFAAHVERVATLHDDEERERRKEDEGNGDFHDGGSP
jgi:hypothetical protein